MNLVNVSLLIFIIILLGVFNYLSYTNFSGLASTDTTQRNYQRWAIILGGVASFFAIFALIVDFLNVKPSISITLTSLAFLFTLVATILSVTAYATATTNQRKSTWIWTMILGFIILILQGAVIGVYTRKPVLVVKREDVPPGLTQISKDAVRSGSAMAERVAAEIAASTSKNVHDRYIVLTNDYIKKLDAVNEDFLGKIIVEQPVKALSNLQYKR